MWRKHGLVSSENEEELFFMIYLPVSKSSLVGRIKKLNGSDMGPRP